MKFNYFENLTNFTWEKNNQKINEFLAVQKEIKKYVN